MTFDPKEILDFWFPDTGHAASPETHGAFWNERMQGGMDAAIIERFADVTRAAARCELDHWAGTPRGRLALLIVLDQFPRSLWLDTPGAFAQDIKATRLVLEAVENREIDSYAPWEAIFCLIALSHCEGPDHLTRMDIIDAESERIIARMPPELAPMSDGLRGQNARVRAIIERFGRHPHRKPILGRLSTLEEEAYIASGDFPHASKVEDIVKSA